MPTKILSQRAWDQIAERDSEIYFCVSGGSDCFGVFLTVFIEYSSIRWEL